VLALRLEVRRGTFRLEAAFDCAEGPTLLLGPNGAGKTTLLRAILGAIPVRQGEVRLGDRVLLDTGAGIDVPTEDRRIGWVPQDYALFPHLTVAENVGFGARGSREQRTWWVAGLLERLGLSAFATRRPGGLSGGERQKTALARALAAEPAALLLDEPLAALDARTREATREFLARILRELAIPSLVVTHDVGDAEALDAPVVLIEEGRVAARAPFQTLRAEPPTGFARDFLQGRVKLT
jgi:molybdate transport system ATP-binding protein